MGAETTKGPVVYLTEQSPATFKVALQRTGLLQRRDLEVVTWAGVSHLSWPEVVRLSIRECKRIGAALLVVDTIGQFTRVSGRCRKQRGGRTPRHAAASTGRCRGSRCHG
jgi:hypothetical protein